MADYALVVGIETYKTPFAGDLQGPSLDALRFALWLHQTQNVPAANIILIHNQCEAWKDDPVGEASYQTVLREVQQANIVMREDPSRQAISDAWQVKVLDGPEEVGTLWIYWSGHGVTFPQSLDAVLCADEEQKNATFVYLPEFRDSLRSKKFSRFRRQRLIVDACSEYIKPEDLDINGLRAPKHWEVTESPEQIELSAVAMGKKAGAERGVGLFSGVLFRQLEKSGWPVDLTALPAFFAAVDAAIAAEAPEDQRPRLRVLSPRYEAGFGTGRNIIESADLLKTLARCEISFDRYRPYYLRTMGLAGQEVLAANTLTAMIGELLQLDREEEFGGLPRRLLEFLCRVTRDAPKAAEPVDAWLRRRVPPGALVTIQDELKQEVHDLVLAIVVQETRLNANGFPASIQASLCDADQAVRPPWTFANLADLDALENAARAIVLEAGPLAKGKNAGMTIHVFANPPLLGIPWQAFPLDPDDPDDVQFGQRYSFILRSRARLEGRDDKYDLDSWRLKSKALRLRACQQIKFEPAPAWSGEAKDYLAKVDGLLFICDTLSASPASPSITDRLLSVALKKGLPLASWRIGVRGDTGAPQNYDWVACQAALRKLFDMTPSLPETPVQFRDARKSESWARETALFWDDDENADKLRQVLEEPDQR